MRSIIGTAILAFAMVSGLFMSAASAEPCLVNLGYIAKTSDPQTYAVDFFSYTDGVANLVPKLYAGDDAYTTMISGVTLERSGTPVPGRVKTWLSNPSYVKLPVAAKPLEFALLDIENPDSQSPTGCTSTVRSVKELDPHGKLGDRSLFQADDGDADRAVAAYVSGTPAIEATLLPREPEPDCAQPYI